jgi:drug/metabolite transporter (DMT)-like permease
MASQPANYRGILAMIGACACFSANDAATKLAAQHLPVTEVVAIRAAFTLVFALLIIAFRRELAALPLVRDPYLMLRAVIEVATGILIIYALSLMPIADLTAILLVQPFLMTIVGAYVLKESVGWRRWMAVAAGFMGMLLVMKPGTAEFDQTSLVALAAAVLVLVRDLLVRKIRAEVPTTVISFATALFGVPIGLLGALAEPWSMPDPSPFVAIVISAAFLIVAFILMVVAFRGTDVSAVSPFRYSIVLFAVLFGVLVFGELPDRTAFLGILVIVAAGLYMLHRETARQRALPLTSETQPPH